MSGAAAMAAQSNPVLRAAIGTYPHTEALKSGRITSPLLRFEFADIPTASISRAFAAMVREHRYDISEMAIATFLQARAHDKELVLLPVVMAARFQEAAMFCRTESDIRSPADLAGRTVGVRAYSQTTGMWLRGILNEEYGVRPEQMRWITFEDAHVAEARDPAWASRAPEGASLLGLLREGTVDAIILGNDVPEDPSLRLVFGDVAAAGERFWNRHHFVPVNHLVTARRSLAEQRPDLVHEIVRLFREAKRAAQRPAGDRDPLPSGRAALAAPIDLAIRYMTEQGMLARPVSLSEVWDGVPDGID